jgi:thiol-disulfide isomerase/thioredoxin
MGAEWCGPCKVFAPKLVQALKAKNQKPGEMAMVYLSGDRTPPEAKRYVTALGISWPMLSFTKRDQIPAFQSLFGNVIPQLVVTDRHGTVVIDSAKVGHDRALAQLRDL